MKKKLRLSVLVLFVIVLVCSSAAFANGGTCSWCLSTNTYLFCDHSGEGMIKVFEHEVGLETCNIYEVYCDTERQCDDCGRDEYVSQHKCDYYHDFTGCDEYGYHDSYFCMYRW